MSRRPLPSIFTTTEPEPKTDDQALWKHQQETRAFSTTTESLLDFSDPGTGKTRAHLAGFHDLLEANECSSLVVLCPKTLIEAAWGEDLNAFYPDTPYSMAYAENREEAFDQDAAVYITNIDAVKWLAEQRKKFFQRFGPRPMLLVDEVTAFKHRTSERSKAMRQLADQHFKSWRRGLTGTPNPISVTELWHQTRIVDGGHRLGQRFVPFRNSVQVRVPKEDERFHDWVDKERAEEAVGFLLRDITIRHRFDECMDIPPNHTVDRRFTPNRRTKQLYDEFETHALLELEKGDVVGVNGGALRAKLLQIASGAVYHQDGSYSVLDTQRYELISDLVENRLHSLVFFNWRHQKEQLSKLLQKRGISHAIIDGTVSDGRRKAIRQAYQAGEYQTILLHPRTGAHGLTLTRGESIIRASPIYEADVMEQEFRRIARGGQTKVTFTENVIARGTVEELIYAQVNDKTLRMNSFRHIIELARTARRAA